MGQNNGNRKNNNKMVLKTGSDDMRAFYDFCMDFMTENHFAEMESERTCELLSWCEDPDMIRMAIMDIKYRDKKRKP